MLPKSNCPKIKENGFNVIELLVVIAIIGILATIFIPKFDQYKQRAYDTESKAHLHNIYSACQAFWSNNSDSCVIDSNLMTNLGFNKAEEVTVIIIDGTKTGFTATAKHNKSSTTFTMNSSGNIS